MNKPEKNLLAKIESSLWLWMLLAALLFGAYLRFALRAFISEDMYNYLLVWYDEIKALGGLKAVGSAVGNYNVLYRFIIAVFTYLPISPVFAYKSVSILFDLLLSVCAWLYVYKHSGVRLKASACSSVIWLSPVLVLNSSMWGQCDVIYTFFVVLALFSLGKEKYTRTFIFLGLALSFKLQAIFILPFIAFYYLKEKKFSILNFLYIPLVMWFTTIPAIICGSGIFDGFKLYFSQTSEYGCLTMNSPSAISFITYNYQQLHYEYLKPIFILLTVIVLATWIIYVLSKKFELSLSAYLAFAIVLTYSTVFFLPAMHERYGFMYEILALFYVFKNRKSIIPCILLQFISLCTYGNYLLQGSYSLLAVTYLNLFVYLWYSYLFLKELTECKGEAHD